MVLACTGELEQHRASVQAYARSGASLWNATSSGCEITSDASGNTYAQVLDGQNSLIESRNPAGDLRWTQSTAEIQSPRADPVIGASGTPYFSQTNGGSVGPVLGLNPSSGAITFNQTVDLTYWLYAYADGLAAVSAGSVQYISYDGRSLGTYEAAPLREFASAGGANGTIFVGATADGICSPEGTNEIIKITPAGRQWTWRDTGHLCGISLAATPDGGVVAVAQRPDGTVDVTHLNPAGAVDWSTPLPGTPQSRPGWEAYYTPRVDAHGTIALMTGYDYVCDLAASGWCSGIQVSFLSQSSGASVQAAVHIAEAEHSLLIPRDLAIDQDRAYIVAVSGGAGTSEAWLAAYSAPGLGIDYRRALQMAMTTGGTGGGGNPPPPVPEPKGAYYVALGDSFSAGEGIDPYLRDGFANGQQPGNVDSRCHRSTRAYATSVRPFGFSSAIYRLASGAGTPGTGKRVNKYGSDQNVRSGSGTSWAFFACSGAKTENIWRAADGGKRQPVATYRERYTQLDNPAIGTATQLVTITIGGNDAGFSDVLKHCALHACNTAAYRAQLTKKIDGLTSRLVKTYSSIRKKAPNAKVLVLGYPHLFPKSAAEQSCGKLTPWKGEQNFLRTETSHMNSAIRDAAVRAGATYVSVAGTPGFSGHEICGKRGEWINGPSSTWKLNRKFVDDESFHPTVRGQTAYASAVNQALR